MDLDTRDLRTFVTLVDTGSFSGAAERLALTQPAVSKRLASLEDRLGLPLIERLPRQLRLTEAGQQLYERARDILRELDNTLTELKNLDEEERGTLRLACSHHIGLHYLPEVIRRFVRPRPQVQFELHFVGSEEAGALIAEGTIDLALITLGSETSLSPFQQVPIWQDRLQFVVSRDHALATLGAVSLEELTHYPALLPDERTETFKQVAELFRREGLSLRPAIPTNYLETLKMMVHVGLGWSVLPETMLDDTLRVITPEGIRVERALGVVLDQRRARSRLAERFIRQLRG